jgi:hypothetical protein
MRSGDTDHVSMVLMKSEPGPPMTLGNAAAARVRLIVWCLDCQHQVEPDPAEMAEPLRCGDERPGLGGKACVRPTRAAVGSTW